MAPKLSPAQLDSKLKALRDYVRAHLADLASGGKRSLKAVFAKQGNAAETLFYKFLHNNEKRFSEAQQRHGDETLALLLRHCESSGDAHSAARTSRSVASSSGRQPDRSRSARRHRVESDKASCSVPRPAALQSVAITECEASSSSGLQRGRSCSATSARGRTVKGDATSSSVAAPNQCKPQENSDGQHFCFSQNLISGTISL